jgi:hypothetical protein
MFRRLFWIVAPLSVFSLACASTTPDEGDSDEAAQSLSVGQLDVCHNGHTISVGAPALAAHLAHGDMAGACGDGGDDEPVGGTGGGPVLGADGASCTDGGQCQSGVCGGSGACVSSCVGSAGNFDNLECTGSSDCCAGAACIFGACYEGETCALAGTACDDFNGPQCCFSLSCVNGTCQ